MRKTAFLIALLLFMSPVQAQQPLRIVSWNMKATLLEGLAARQADFQRLNANLNPNVLVLIEVAGVEEAKNVAQALGWTDYQAVVTNFLILEDTAVFALELAVISKEKINHAVEFDTVMDTGPAVFGNGALAANLPSVSEQKLTNTSLPDLGAFTENDRGTIRVDLDNGLTIFPVHLKSNFSQSCQEIDKARSRIRSQDARVASKLDRYFEKGFRAATKESVDSAKKRERMMAAVLSEANAAATEGRIVLIAGDFNTGFEPNKFGTKLDDDCSLHNFSCKAAPFPSRACPTREGDGFDDTLSIPEQPLVGTKRWTFLTRTLGRTFKETAFADLAIDHMVVPADQASLFAIAKKSDSDTFGSDHFAVFTDVHLP